MLPETTTDEDERRDRAAACWRGIVGIRWLMDRNEPVSVTKARVPFVNKQEGRAPPTDNRHSSDRRSTVTGVRLPMMPLLVRCKP